MISEGRRRLSWLAAAEIAKVFLELLTGDRDRPSYSAVSARAGQKRTSVTPSLHPLVILRTHLPGGERLLYSPNRPVCVGRGLLTAIKL